MSIWYIPVQYCTGTSSYVTMRARYVCATFTFDVGTSWSSSPVFTQATFVQLVLRFPSIASFIM